MFYINALLPYILLTIALFGILIAVFAKQWWIWIIVMLVFIGCMMYSGVNQYIQYGAVLGAVAAFLTGLVMAFKEYIP